MGSSGQPATCAWAPCKRCWVSTLPASTTPSTAAHSPAFFQCIHRGASILAGTVGSSGGQAAAGCTGTSEEWEGAATVRHKPRQACRAQRSGQCTWQAAGKTDGAMRVGQARPRTPAALGWVAAVPLSPVNQEEGVPAGPAHKRAPHHNIGEPAAGPRQHPHLARGGARGGGEGRPALVQRAAVAGRIGHAQAVLLSSRWG